MNTPAAYADQLPSNRARRQPTNHAGTPENLTASPAAGSTAAREAARARARLLASVAAGTTSIADICDLAAEGVTSARKLHLRQVFMAAYDWSAAHTDNSIARLLLDANVPRPRTRITVGWVADRDRLVAAIRRLTGVDTIVPDPHYPFPPPRSSS